VTAIGDIFMCDLEWENPKFNKSKIDKNELLETIKSGLLCKRTGLNVEEYMKEMREERIFYKK